MITGVGIFSTSLGGGGSLTSVLLAMAPQGESPNPIQIPVSSPISHHELSLKSMH